MLNKADKERQNLEATATIMSLVSVGAMPPDKAFDIMAGIGRRNHEEEVKQTTDEVPPPTEPPWNDQAIYLKFVKDKVNEIVKKIENKQSQYIGDDMVLSAITDTADKMVVGRPSTIDERLRVILTLMDKHVGALMKRGTALPDLEDRLTDIIVYCFMAMYLLDKDIFFVDLKDNAS